MTSSVRAVVSIAGRPGMMHGTWVAIAIMRCRLRLVMYDIKLRSSVMRLSVAVLWSSIAMAIVWLSMVLPVVLVIVWLMNILRLSHMVTYCALRLLLGYRDMQLVNGPALC